MHILQMDRRPFVKYAGTCTWWVCVYISSYAANIDYKVHGKPCVCLKHYILLSVGFMLMKMQSYFFDVQLLFERPT